MTNTEELSELAGIGLESNLVDVKDTERGFYRDMSGMPGDMWAHC